MLGPYVNRRKLLIMLNYKDIAHELTKHSFPSSALAYAIEANNFNILQYICINYTHITTEMSLAVKLDRRNFVDYLAENGADMWKHYLFAAINDGNIELVDYFVRKGLEEKARWGDCPNPYYSCLQATDDWNLYLALSTEKNHIKLVKYFINRGATNIHECMVKAIHLGYADIAGYLESVKLAGDHRAGPQ